MTPFHPFQSRNSTVYCSPWYQNILLSKNFCCLLSSLECCFFLTQSGEKAGNWFVYSFGLAISLGLPNFLWFHNDKRNLRVSFCSAFFHGSIWPGTAVGHWECLLWCRWSPHLFSVIRSVLFMSWSSLISLILLSWQSLTFFDHSVSPRLQFPRTRVQNRIFDKLAHCWL